MENLGDQVFAPTNSFHYPYYPSSEFDADFDPSYLPPYPPGDHLESYFLQDNHLDQALAGLGRLSLSSSSDRVLCSDSGGNAGFGRSHSNRVNDRLYYPPCEEETIMRQSNVETQRIRSQHGDVQQRSINEGVFAGERLCLARGDHINGESVDPLGNFRNTRRSAMNNRHSHWLKEPFSYFSVGDFQGKIVSLAKDQCGCRYLQNKLGETTRGEINMIFVEVIEHVRELMLDPFGNYVVQKLVEVCSEEQRTQILLMVTRRDLELARICLDMHGTRSVQKLLEHLTTQEQISLIVSAVRDGVYTLTTDVNGHHVIQHCLKHFSAEDNKSIMNVMVNYCFAIATDKSGCCVLQQCVDYSNGEIKEHLINEILANALHLSEDRYGNYVVQHLLDLKIPQTTKNLVRQLEGHYLVLSCDKYGSNVVQKCLEESGEEDSTFIINELLSNPHVSTVLLHPYGNYVIQSALSVSKDFTHGSLLQLIRKNFSMMRYNLYGKKLLTWIGKRSMRQY